MKKKKVQKKPERINTLLKAGDTVIVIAGGNKDKRPNKGVVGKLVRFAGKKRDRVFVEGVNIVTKHKKATAPGESGGKVQQPASIHISNVMFYVETEKRGVRLSTQALEDGRKVRGYKAKDSDGKTAGEFVQV